MEKDKKEKIEETKQEVFSATHIATICKFVELNVDEVDRLLILIPIETLYGKINRSHNFVDSKNQSYLPVYDAFNEQKHFGYILDTSFSDIYKRGKNILASALGEKAPTDASFEDIYQTFLEEYFDTINDNVWFFSLNHAVPVLTGISETEFYDYYGFSIDRKTEVISCVEPGANEELYNRIKENLDKNNEQETENKKITRLGLIEETKKKVIAQDEAVSEIASAIYNPLALNSSEMKRNILVYGPTGVGKTFILETIAKELGLPFYETSLADFSSSGYVGRSIDDIYNGLYNAANGDIDLLEKGAILFLDEVDKLVLGGSSDIKSQVYHELLTLYQPGGTVDIKVGWNKTVPYDKKNLIIVSGGSFAKLGSNKPRQMGFGAKSSKIDEKEYYTNEDFIKFGIPAEFMGRQDLCIPLRALNKEDLYRVLTESIKSPYIVQKEVLKNKGISLNISEEILKYMADKAFSLEKGARSLKGIFAVAITPEINNIVDQIDGGLLETKSFDVDSENVVKRLKMYNG